MYDQNNKFIWFRILMICLINISTYLSGTPQYLTDRDRRDLGELQKYIPSSSAIELRNIISFPNKIQEEDSYLWNPSSIARDKKGNIFVSDTKANSIIVYDSVGKYKYKFGRQGQGPGDLNMPMGLWVIEDELVVIEARNRRLQWMDLFGKYIKSLSVFKTYCDISIISSGELVAAPALFKIPDEDMLIEILSSDGKIKRKFGNPLKYKNDQYILNQRSLFINERKEIIQTFTNIPIIQAYSMEGELLREKMIDTGYSKKIDELNRRKSTYSENVLYMPIFEDTYCIGDEIFISGKLWEYIYIWALDNEFNIKKTYWFKGGEKYFIRDFIPYYENGRLYFAILGMKDEAKVYIFAQ